MDTLRKSGLDVYGQRGPIMGDGYDSDETEMEGADVEVPEELLKWVKSKLDNFKYGEQITESIQGTSFAAKIKRWVVSTLNDVSASRPEPTTRQQAEILVAEYMRYHTVDIRNKQWKQVFDTIRASVAEFLIYFMYGRIHPVATIYATQRNMRAR